MRRQEHTLLRQLIQASALRSFSHVFGPDHPLLFRGPDLLLGNQQTLTGIFVPNAAEQRNPAHLIARLIATRLAYPNEMRCVLLAFKEYPYGDLTKDFDGWFTLQDRHLIDFLADNSPRRREKMSPEMRQRAMKRFDQALRGTAFSFRLQRRSRRENPERSTSISARLLSRLKSDLPTAPSVESSGYRLRPTSRYIWNQTPIVVTESERHQTVLRRIKSTSEIQYLDDFQLDNGTPHFRGQANFAVFVSPRGAEVFDPSSKTSLASAFAGITFAPTDDPAELDEFVARVPFLPGPTSDESPWLFDSD